MKRGHFEAFRPVCPRCAREGAQQPVTLGPVLREQGDSVVEGLLDCARCGLEFPILDGLPVLVPDPRDFLAQNAFAFLMRDDLSDGIEQRLGECAGAGSAVDATRSILSNYVWDHWGEFDPAESARDPQPGGIVRLLARASALDEPGEAVLDAGCAAGRATFELAAKTRGLVLGVDLSVPLLRLAQRVLATGVVRYPRRHLGLVYERREFEVPIAAAERVDFWIADAAALPFAAGGLSAVWAGNLLDCLGAPLEFLRELARLLAPGAAAALATPYDWSTAATAAEAWIGGHSTRAPGGGDSASILRALLTEGAHPASVSGLELSGEEGRVRWAVRVHDRSAVHYDAHLLSVRATATPAPAATE